MTLTVWIPTEVLLKEDNLTRINAKAESGWFGILPRHVDYVTALVPCVLTFQGAGKPEQYLAIDHGILVKCGAEVKISTRNAIHGTSLEGLKKEVETQFLRREELEAKARSREAKLESELVRRLLEAEKSA